MRHVQQAMALSGYEPDIGRWLWAIEEARRGTLRAAKDLDQRTLDWEGPDGRENAIGSLLYHIALVEMSWLFLDILEQKFPLPVKSDFPLDMGNVEVGLTRVPNVALAEHLGRLERSRAIFLDAFRYMTLDDWRHFRSPKGVDYQVTPEWAVFHLLEHEAGHAFQISALKTRASRFFQDE